MASRKSARTRRAYQNDVMHFMATLHIRSPEESRRVDHRAVMAWERIMREQEGSQPTTVRQRLAALSSLFAYLVKFGVVEMNPVRDVERPVVKRREGMTLAFSQKQARAILDKPDPGRVHKGEVWWVRLPFGNGREQAGERPVVIIQDDAFVPILPLVLVVPLTGEMAASRFAATLVIQPDAHNGLIIPSVALVF